MLSNPAFLASHGHRGTRRDILGCMLAVKAHVEQGRLKLDEPTSLPEGEIVELVPLDEVLANGGDCLDDEERKALHAALDEAEADIKAGRVVSEEEVWATLGDEERSALHQEIAASIKERRSGAPTFSAEEVLADLGSRQ
jgi:predicted DNA-binding antitoxin AbrB/MazE fold protein